MLLYLYAIFFRIGLFAVGGGLATIPFLQEIVEKYGWITSQELLDIIAIAESTPGPIGINAATFVGYKISGVLGGIVAVVGIVTPSLIIIVMMAKLLKKFTQSQVVQASFYGIRPVVAGLIGAAGFEVAKITLFNIKAFSLFIIALYVIMKFKKHPILYLVGGAVVGILFNIH